MFDEFLTPPTSPSNLRYLADLPQLSDIDAIILGRPNEYDGHAVRAAMEKVPAIVAALRQRKIELGHFERRYGLD